MFYRKAEGLSLLFSLVPNHFLFVLYHKLIHNARTHLNYFQEATGKTPWASNHQDPRFKIKWRKSGSFNTEEGPGAPGATGRPLAADLYKWEN